MVIHGMLLHRTEVKYFFPKQALAQKGIKPFLPEKCGFFLSLYIFTIIFKRL